MWSAPIGAIRVAVRQNLPSWAVLGFRFFRGSVLEIINDGRPKALLITTLKVLEIKEVLKLDIYATTRIASEEHTSTKKR